MYPLDNATIKLERDKWYQWNWRSQFGVDRSFSLLDLRCYKVLFCVIITLAMTAIIVGVLVGVGVIPGHGRGYSTWRKNDLIEGSN